jgi:FkbM family methyltransferase
MMVCVDNINFYRVKAIHPHWNGVLRLSNCDNSIFHEGPGSRGIYTLLNDKLVVSWDNYKPEVFFKTLDVYVHESIRPTDVNKLLCVMIGNKIVETKRISVLIENSGYEVSLRLQTSDIPTFNQVFISNEYDSPNLPSSADVVVDLGANIGLATVFFGLKYPEAKILSVEPESDSFYAMVGNTAALGDRVQKKHAAVWLENGFINLHTEGEDGSPLGAWGVQVSDRISKRSKLTRCYRLGTLIEDAGFSSVDILKVDIEGAELEMFSHEAAEWLSKIALIIVETHDRFRPGSEEAVRKAVHPMFEELPRSGENLFFRRKPRA